MDDLRGLNDGLTAKVDGPASDNTLLLEGGEVGAERLMPFASFVGVKGALDVPGTERALVLEGLEGSLGDINGSSFNMTPTTELTTDRAPGDTGLVDSELDFASGCAGTATDSGLDLTSAAESSGGATSCLGVAALSSAFTLCTKSTELEEMWRV